MFITFLKYVFSAVKVEMATCRWMQKGICQFREYDVIKSQSCALAASHHSRPHLLLFDSNLFSSPSLVFLILFTESYIHPNSQLLHVFTVEIVGDQVELLV